MRKSILRERIDGDVALLLLLLPLLLPPQDSFRRGDDLKPITSPVGPLHVSNSSPLPLVDLQPSLDINELTLYDESCGESGARLNR